MSSLIKEINLATASDWAGYSLTNLVASDNGITLINPDSEGIASIVWNLWDLSLTVESFALIYEGIVPDNSYITVEYRWSEDAGESFTAWVTINISELTAVPLVNQTLDPSLFRLHTRATLGLSSPGGDLPVVSRLNLKVYSSVNITTTTTTTTSTTTTTTTIAPIPIVHDPDLTIKEGDVIDYNLELSTNYMTRSKPLLITYTILDLTSNTVVATSHLHVYHNVVSLQIANNSLLNINNLVEQRLLTLVIHEYVLKEKTFYFNIERT